MQLSVIKPNRGTAIHYSNLKNEFELAYQDIKNDLSNKNRLLPVQYPVLSKPNSNTKLAKSTDRTAGYLLHSLFLAPSGASGYNTCAWASDECISLCLNSAGRGAMQSVQDARIKKTKRMVESPRTFMKIMLSEMIIASRQAKKAGKSLAIRLNGTSDIPWEHCAPFLEAFCIGGQYENSSKEINDLTKFSLYDYTKSYNRVKDAPSWYDMTLSYSGYNWNECKKILDEKTSRVAMVFHEEVPNEYEGYDVFNGDEDDYRFKDLKGVIIGLSYKSVGKDKDKSAMSTDLRFVQKLLNKTNTDAKTAPKLR